MDSRSIIQKTLNRCIPTDGKLPDQTSEDCTICCEKVTDKAFVNDCGHYFCYKCIKQWICVRAVCPLCVQPISSIINNIRSVDDYDLQIVEPPKNDVLSNWDNEVELWAIADDEDYDDIFDPEIMSTDENLIHSGYEFDLADIIDDMTDEVESIFDNNVADDDSEDGDADIEISDDDIEVSSESENEEAKSFQYDTSSEMEDDSFDFENYLISENDECENSTDNISEESYHEIEYDPYFNLSNDSDDDNSLVDYYYEEYNESALSSYETQAEDSDHYYSYDDSLIGNYNSYDD